MVQTDREYAEALFSLALESEAEKAYLEALATVKGILDKEPEYLEFLSSPAIPVSERTASLDEAFDGVLPEYVLSFLGVLVEKGKIRSLPGCIGEYEKLVKESQKRVLAKVISAVPLSEEQTKAIAEKLEKRLGKSIDPVLFVDESLLGGVRVEVDGRIFDGSVRHRLSEMKEVMKA